MLYSAIGAHAEDGVREKARVLARLRFDFIACGEDVRPRHRHPAHVEAIGDGFVAQLPPLRQLAATAAAADAARDLVSKTVADGL